LRLAIERRPIFQDTPWNTNRGGEISEGMAQSSSVMAQDLFEAHLTVADLDRSIAFYRDVVGLALAHVARERQAAFFWIGAPGNAMLGLWAGGSSPQRMTLHVAFRAKLADVIAAPQRLPASGITPLDFDGKPTDQPVVLAWMPAASVFFRDPDGHLLEYVAMLEDRPRPEFGVLPWRMWELLLSLALTAPSSPALR
jgi:lactoylglutathione lyase